MKKIVKPIYALVFLILAFASCNKEQDNLSSIKEELKNVKVDSTEIIKAALKKLGFKTDNLIMEGDDIVVEGDMILSKKLLLDSTLTTPRHATGLEWPVLEKLDLRVYFKTTPDVPWDIELSLNQIIEIKSVFNLFLTSNLPFGDSGLNSITYVNTPYEGHDILVEGISFTDNRCGDAKISTQVIKNGILKRAKVGDRIRFSIEKFSFEMTADQRKRTIAHEFGHTLGLRHTNWFALGEAQYIGSVGAYSIPQTEGPDPLEPDLHSVFNGGRCGTIFNGFTEKDKIAINYVCTGASPS